MVRNRNRSFWKRHYQSLELSEQDSEQDDTVDISFPEHEKGEVVEKSAEQSSPIKIPRLTNEQLSRFIEAYSNRNKISQRTEIAKRAKEITQFNPYSIKIDPNSTINLIYEAVSSSDKPIHINSIIEQIEAKGWTTGSKYHKYSQVYSAIKKHYYLFERAGKGLFTIRKAFTDTKPARTNPPTKLSSNPIPKLEDLLASIVKNYLKEDGLTPHKLHYIVGQVGINCSYSTIYRALQKQPFIRNGDFYSVAEV